MLTLAQLIPESCYTGDAAGLIQQIYAYTDKVVHDAVVPLTRKRVVKATAIVNLYLQPVAAETIPLIVEGASQELVVESCQRVICQQYMLWNWYLENLTRHKRKLGNRCPVTLASPPGHSDHEQGLALDIKNYVYWKPRFQAHGWHWQGPNDRAHFSFHGHGTRHDLANIVIKGFQRFYNANNTIKIVEDGIFGPKTEQALRNSPVDGISWH